MKTKFIMVLILGLLLVSCAGRIPRPDAAPPLLDPKTFGHDLFVRGHLALSISGHSIETEALVELSKSTMNVVILGPSPRPWLRVQLFDDDWTVDEAEQLRKYPLHPRRLLGDFQLFLWPELWNGEMKKFRVQEKHKEPRERRIYGPDGLFARIEYRSWPPWTGRVHVYRPSQNYHFTFEPVTANKGTNE